MSLLYHYTTFDIFKRILKQGAVLPDKTEPQNPKERATVTFSSHPTWEPTRYRIGRLPNEQLIMMNKALLNQFCGGLVRIGIDRATAPLDWHAMKDHAGISQQAMTALYDFALSVGARTSHWFATFEPVPQEKWVCVQKMVENEWVDLKESEFPSLDDVSLDEPPASIVEIKFDSLNVQNIQNAVTQASAPE